VQPLEVVLLLNLQLALFVLSESNSILPRAWADIEVFLMLGVLVVGRWERAVSPKRFGMLASSGARWDSFSSPV
jgi:hypothetical protein